MKTLTGSAVIFVSSLLLPALAFAHPGHESDGFLQAMFHPQHVALAIITVGVVGGAAALWRQLNARRES